MDQSDLTRLAIQNIIPGIHIDGTDLCCPERIAFYTKRSARWVQEHIKSRQLQPVNPSLNLYSLTEFCQHPGVATPAT